MVADVLIEEAGSAPDTTGDADVAHRARAPTHLTPLEQTMADSVMFHLAGVDKLADFDISAVQRELTRQRVRDQ